MSRGIIAKVATFLALSAIAFVIIWNLGSAGAHWDLQLWALILIALGVGAIATLLVPFVVITPYRWVRDQIRRVEVSDLIAAPIGLVVGLIIAALLAFP